MILEVVTQPCEYISICIFSYKNVYTILKKLFYFFSEITGYVEQILPIETIHNRFERLMFFISNGDIRIPICIWSDLIPKYRSIIRLGSVLHLDGLLSKSTVANDFHHHLELHVQIYSGIQNLGIFIPINNVNE